jgi:hypothetical protein
MNKREYWYCQECSEMERPCILTTDEQPFSDGDGPGCCPFDNSGAGVPSRWMRRSPKIGKDIQTVTSQDKLSQTPR